MSTRVLVGTRKGLFSVERGARGGWSVARADFLGDPVTMVLPEAGGKRLHAALELGHFGCKMHVSQDGGTSWAESAMPTFPEKPDDLEDLDPFRKLPIPWAVKTIWALEQGTPDQSGRLWCGTIPGGLFRSDDGGASWDLVRSLWDHPERKKWFGGGADFAGIHSVVVDPRDGRHVTLGVSCGGVWVTRDDGETWEQHAHGMRADFLPPEQQLVPDQQDPHRIVQCAARPDTMWAQHHCGIFKTTNDCRSWEEVTDVAPSAFGFGVAVHPRDPDVAFFVPGVKDEKRYPVDGKVVVTRTRDGGRSFDVLRDGLPQEFAYDLVYRHALEIDDSGERLVLGSTTGSLWISEDQGEHFTCVTNHLPPIYCARFVS